MMTKKCQHEPDWDSTEVAARDDEYCEVALVCLHCGENAFADIGPDHFKWSHDGSPVDDLSPHSVGSEEPPDDAA